MQKSSGECNTRPGKGFISPIVAMKQELSSAATKDALVTRSKGDICF